MHKRFFCNVTASLLSLVAGAGFAAAQTKSAATPDDNPTAYTALRLISKTLGRDALERVVEITGREGAPQPFIWKVVLKDGPGSREVDVAGGKIEAQRTLTRPPAATVPIRLGDLNLDSSGAFDATDVQARRVKLRYDSLNYALLVSSTTNKPVWTIDLLNKEGIEVGAIRLAAHDGTTLSTEGRLANNPPPVTRDNLSTASTLAAPPRPATPTTTPRPVERPATRETTVTSTTTTIHRTVPPPTPSTATTPESIPVATLSDHGDDGDNEARSESGPEQGGLFTRTGRTLDKTSHTVERSFRKAGASVQRFFTGHSDIDQEDHRE